MSDKNKMTIDELIAYYKRNAEKYEYDNGAARALEIDAKPIIDAQAATIAQLREALEQADETVNDMAYIIHDADTNDQEKFEKLEARWMKYPIVKIGSLIDDAIHARALKGGK